ncbi:hypothetical protein ABZ446_21380 [Streptomyces sp. NPDC005813]|uniref:hypothetical protein n=1 Tax=Streptomyces sp. NPDC005813 TaxID=3155592 RepID=UPI00340E9D09
MQGTMTLVLGGRATAYDLPFAPSARGTTVATFGLATLAVLHTGRSTPVTERSSTALTGGPIVETSAPPFTPGNRHTNQLREVLTATVRSVRNGPLRGGSAVVTTDSTGIGGCPASSASRPQEAIGKTRPEEVIAAAGSGRSPMTLSSELSSAGTPPARLHAQTGAPSDSAPGQATEILKAAQNTAQDRRVRDARTETTITSSASLE